MSETDKDRRGPVLIEGDDPALAGPEPSPADAPPPDAPELEPDDLAARAEVPALRWPGSLFWGSLVGLVGLALVIGVYDFVGAMLERNLWLGRAALALAVMLTAALVGLALREMASLARLRAIDGVRRLAERARREEDLSVAREAVDALDLLYRRRPELEWAHERVEARRDDALDAGTLLALAEREYLYPLDSAAERAVARASRQVATATALIPLAFADVAAAMFVNLRMLREVAAIYGGRAGALGSWRLLRAVAAHLAATGLVAVGDDVIGPVLGGSMAAKLSRRFGEGLVNGALTARIGVVAMDLCRPLPYATRDKPTTSRMTARALKGFVG